MKKEIIASLLAGVVLFILLSVSFVGADYAICNWSRNSFNSNHADSCLTQGGTFLPIWQIISGDTVAQAYRADSVKWGSGYRVLGRFLPDSLALFLRLHGQADSSRSADTAYTLQGKDTTKIKGLLVENAASANNAKNADSLRHYLPDFPVSLMAESLAVKATMTNTGRGLFTADSLNAIKWLRSALAKLDTIEIPGTTVKIYLRDAATANVFGNWFFNGQVQAYGGVDGVANGTLTNFASIKNSATVGVKVASDSLIITPEGGIAVLMKNVWAADSTLYRGNPAVLTGAKKSVSGASANTQTGFGICYSDSINYNGWGYVAISGLTMVAIANGGTSTTWAIGNTVNRTVQDGGTMALDQQMWGQLVDTLRLGVNARGDSLVLMRVAPAYTQTP